MRPPVRGLPESQFCGPHLVLPGGKMRFVLALKRVLSSHAAAGVGAGGCFTGDLSGLDEPE